MGVTEITAEVFTRVPEALRMRHHSAWSKRRGAGVLHSFLEGPAFDTKGRFYCTDVCHGRIFRVDRAGHWEVFTDYGGEPNGLALHRDGTVFVADAKLGVLAFDPDTGQLLTTQEEASKQPFNGVNDLHFANDGTLFVTDPGASDLASATGRVFARWRDERFEQIARDLPFPNGIALNPEQNALCITVTRSMQVLRANWRDGALHNLGLFAQLSGGLAGPDGMAFCADGGFVVAHSGLATVWLFSKLGEPVARINSPAEIRTTNVAFDPENPAVLFITESESGSILKATLPARGHLIFSHS